MRSDFNQHNVLETRRQILPYKFIHLMNGKLSIRNTRDQTLVVSRNEVERILERDDLDVHRRKMYEAALEEFKKDDPKTAVQ